MFEKNKLSEEIDFNNLTYHYKIKSASKYFIRFKDPLIIYNYIKNGRISLHKEEKIQEEFQSKLNEILKGNANYESKDQISTTKNIKNLYKGRLKVLNNYNDYARTISDGKYKSIHGEGFKTLASKAMLQRLALALAQVKAGNTSKNLLNEIRQIMYSLYREKEVTKKVDTNIISSIKL